MTEILALLMKKCEEQEAIVEKAFEKLPYLSVSPTTRLEWEGVAYFTTQIDRLACLGLAIMDEQIRMFNWYDANDSRIAKIYSAQSVFNFLFSAVEWVRNRNEQWLHVFPGQSYIRLMSKYLEFKEALDLLSRFDDYKNDLEQFKF